MLKDVIKLEDFNFGEIVVLKHSLGIDSTLIGTRVKIIRKRINIFNDTEYLVECVGARYNVFNQWLAEPSCLIKIN